MTRGAQIRQRAAALLAGAARARHARHDAVARGKQAPITPLLLQIVFPDDYTITIAGCAKAVSRALRREPKLGADQLAQLLMHRSEELYFSLQAAARSGDVKAILAAVRLLEFQASLGDAKGQLIAPPVSEP